jgi:AcrR family transcriptional regulator
MPGNTGPTQRKEDRRVGRTRTLLEGALYDLIVEKGYDGVTVQDIIDRANVGRSTFYAHYTDKKQLLFSHFGELEAELSEQQRLVRARTDDPIERVFGFSVAMFRHANQYRRVWGAMVGRQSGAAVLRELERILEKIVGREINALVARGSAPAVPASVITRFVVDSLLSMHTWWMDEGNRYSAEEADRMFRTLTKPGIAAALRSAR